MLSPVEACARAFTLTLRVPQGDPRCHTKPGLFPLYHYLYLKAISFFY